MSLCRGKPSRWRAEAGCSGQVLDAHGIRHRAGENRETPAAAALSLAATVSPLQKSLRLLQQRFNAQLFIECLGAFLLGAAGLLVVGAAVRFEIFGRAPLVAGGFLLGAFVAAAVWTFLHRFTPERAARRIDALAGTRDRFVTACEFSQIAAPAPLQSSALRECTEFIQRFDHRSFGRLQFPSAARWLFAPIIALALLAWHHQLAHPALRIDPAAEAELSQNAAALEQLAQQVEQRKRETPSAELDRIAAELREAAERLRAEQRASAEEAAKAALRQLSELESMVKSMEKSSARELAEALAKSLQSIPNAADASDALQSGEAAKSAAALDKLAEENNTPASQEAVEKALREAQEHLEKQRSEAARSMAEARQSASGSSDALRRLAEMLRQMGGPRGQTAQRSGAGGQADPETLKQLLRALENMKLGQKPSGSELSSKGSPGRSAGVSFQNFGQNKPGAGQMNLPSGQPGSERDPGTTQDPFGAKGKADADPGQQTHLAGALGEGESLQELITAAGDDSHAQRRYRDLFQAAAPAAEESVLNENIPPGSRFFVKRYFESIRPRE
jgi:hypothetical protein